MEPMLAKTVAIVAITMAAACAQPEEWMNQPDSTTFRGCLQGSGSDAYVLLAPTGDGSGSDIRGQMMTYRLAGLAETELSDLVNKTVEVEGTVSTEDTSRGSLPAPVPDTVRGTGGAGGSGIPGESTAFYYAHGTLTATAIREVAPTCAIRTAPDRDDADPEPREQ